MDTPSRSVLISGVGIAGPTLAHWLQRYGFTITLIERAPRLRTGGYAVDFWGLGYDVAERMGLVPDLRREGYDVHDLRFVDTHGLRVGGFCVDVFRELANGRYLTILRSDLARSIYRAIDGHCETIFGDSISSVAQDGDGVTVTFERGPARRFDFLIGADGLHSAVRRLVFGRQEQFERYLGYLVAAFEVRGYRPRDEEAYVSYCMPGKQVGRFAMRDDRTMFMFVFAAGRDDAADARDPARHRQILHREFDRAGWECPRILAALDRCDELYFDRVSQISMEGWSRGRVALLGDAAFCPSLLAGQGSALAMAAAYVLAGELAKDGSAAAFERYERLLRPFMASKQRAAEQFASSFAPRTRFGLLVRNQVSKALRVPWIARFVIGRGLLDRLALPTYSAR
jgi:2-polyprenyl-6-methoxyphenol hydroxylase-like FAD-dependent oxidoreductase